MMYRYGYQGQFAERDEETGWSSFELRMYDPIIARWLMPDPYRQHWSPYMAMGNNPSNLIDPDGGMDGDPNPFGKGGNFIPDQGGERSYYATILDEILVRPSFSDFVQDLLDAFDGKLGFFITGGGSDNFGQSSSTGKDIITIDMATFEELFGLSKEFRKFGTSKHNPKTRTFDNQTNGDRVGEISESIRKFYEVLEAHGSRHKNPNIFIRQVEYEPGKYATDTIFLNDGQSGSRFTDTLKWYPGRLNEKGFTEWRNFWKNKANGKN